MSTRWFWAWRRLKTREADETPTELTDQAFVSAVISAICAKRIPAGDGKFSRVETYIKGVRDELEWARENWVGSDEVFTAFFAGVDAMATEFERTVEEIKKGH